MGSLVTYEFKDGVATITMDDGKANALSPDMQAGLNEALDQARADKAVVVLRGRPGSFSAGFDLKILMAGGKDAVKMLTGGFELAERLMSSPRPVVMACTGHALAMGVFLLGCADYSIGTEGAFKIGANEVAIGLTMPHAAIEICRARLAPAHFNRAMMTSEIYSPADAVAAGFLDRIVPEAELLAEAQACAARFSKLNMNAYNGTKQRLRENFYKNLRAAMELDRGDFRVMCKVPD
jgi:enoyl-CoA hydratase